jgi:hypothetical protein
MPNVANRLSHFQPQHLAAMSVLAIAAALSTPSYCADRNTAPHCVVTSEGSTCAAHSIAFNPSSTPAKAVKAPAKSAPAENARPGVDFYERELWRHQGVG